MRLFIGTPLAADLSRQLSPLVATVVEATGPAMRPVSDGSEHLTHLFLGERDPALVGEIVARLAALGEAAAIAARLGAAHLFGRRRPRVLCLRVTEGGEAISELSMTVHRTLVPLLPDLEGAPPKAPHVTLARFGRRAGSRERARASRAVASTGLGDWSAPWSVDRVDLMESRLTPSGAVYGRLATVDLDG